jgi:hypothetical protein
MVLLHHQADVQSDRLFLPLDRQFRLAILIVTVLVKLLFFPLANKSYASMAKMKAVQPEMMAIRERYGDDKMKQQQALMELYKKEKINPLAGLSSDRGADPGVLRALQGAVHHHRDAPRAVHRLDQGSLGAGSDQPVQPVRAAARTTRPCCRSSVSSSTSASGRS